MFFEQKQKKDDHWAVFHDEFDAVEDCRYLFSAGAKMLYLPVDVMFMKKLNCQVLKWTKNCKILVWFFLIIIIDRWI